MTKKTITDEKLTLYYYNDGLSEGERHEIANALAVDSELVSRYQHLNADLVTLSQIEDVQPPADMVERWHDTVKRSARATTQTEFRANFHSWSFFWGVAVTAALAIGIGIGTYFSSTSSEQVPFEPSIASTNDEQSPFMRSLRMHLRDSEATLADFAVDSSTNRSDLIIEIIEQNRLFEKAAERNDEQNIARVLRAFELVLVRIAAEETSIEDADALRAKLMFELNIMLTKLSQETSETQQII